jgi:ketosteroid isomerase-like protein
MSEGNIEIVRRAWEAWEREDWEPLYALYHPDIVWDASALRGPISGVYHGHEGVRSYFREWLDSFETHEARAEKFSAAGDDVIVGLRLRGRGKTSGVEVEMSRWNLYRIRNGLAIRVELFETEAEAIEAAGLSGTHAHADS